MCRGVFASIAIVLFAGLASPVAAQQRQYQGLFGGGYGETEQSLVFQASFGTGYDTNMLRGRISPDAEDPNFNQRRESKFIGGSAGLGYSVRRSTVSFGASLQTSANYYEALEKPQVNGVATSASLSWNPHYRISLSAAQALSYGPALSLSGVNPLIETSGPPPEFLRSDIYVEERLFASSSASFGYNIARNLTASAGYGQSNDLWASGVRNLSSRQGNAGISYGRQVKRYFGFRVGYTYQATQYETVAAERQWIVTHGGDIGLSFGRNGALELTRRTRASFGIGLGSGRGLRPNEKMHYTVTGNAGIVRDVGRTFQASLSYNRSLGFNSFYQEPVLTDALNAAYGGLLTRRLSFNAGAGTSFANVGFTEGDNKLNSYSANMGLGYALSRLLSLNLTYFYTQFNVGAAVALPDGVQRVGDRHVVRASISFQAPLYSRAKRPNASR